MGEKVLILFGIMDREIGKLAFIGPRKLCAALHRGNCHDYQAKILVL